MYYTKYRPQKFSDIAKPNEIAESLSLQVKTGKTAHAYLFVGSRGTGKTTTARILAKALNCKKLQKNGDPCNECENCVGIRSGNFLDLIEIDAASNRGIDDIRDLKEKVRLAPSMGKNKVYIIDEVHMLTTEAFNALLKTLEEPPKHVVFILCTTELHKVPDTIKSRCQVFKFKRATTTQLVSKLSKIAQSESAEISKEKLAKIADLAFGGFRDAETLLQQVIEGSLDVDLLINTSTKDLYAEFVLYLEKKEAGPALKIINKKYEEGIDLYVWTGELLRYLRDLLFFASNASDGLADMTPENQLVMKKQAENLGSLQIVEFIEAFIKAQNLIKSSFITQLPLEIAVVQICGGLGEDETSPSVRESASGGDEAVSPQNKPTDRETRPPSKNKFDLKLEIVEKNWQEILNKVTTQNHGILALLKHSRAVSTEKNIIILEVFYAFHKERLENSKNRKMVEKTLEEVFGMPVSYKCVISKNTPPKASERETGVLTDYNLKIPSGNITDIFDGALPL